MRPSRDWVLAAAALAALVALPGGIGAEAVGAAAARSGPGRHTAAQAPSPAAAAFTPGRPPATAAQAPAGISVSPQPNTPDASPETQISFLGARPDTLGAITVVGSRSGRHPGTLRSYAAAPGASYVPSRRFAVGETVRVRVDPKAGGLTAPLSFRFTIARRSAFPAPPRTPVSVGHSQTQSFPSAPGLHPPKVTITRSLPGQAPGDLFLGVVSHRGPSGSSVSQQGPMIIDASGRLVYFHPLHGRMKAENFRVQDLHGAPVLTWWQGRINPLGFGRGDDLIYDNHYRLVARIRGGNGERPDLHEFVVTPEGTAWLTSVVPVRADLRSVGGPANGPLLDFIVQEIDIKTGLVMFEWHPLGHIPLRESYAKYARTASINPYHINSIQLLANNTILLSARDTWSVYDVSLATGKILGRLGGKRSTFTLDPGARFAYQHDAQARPDGLISLFDDEASPVVGHRSRGLLLGVDLSSRVAQVVHQYVHASPPLLTGSQGSMQNLPNGDELLGWGGEPYFSEYAADGRLLLDGHLPSGVQSYRAYRFPWVGLPDGRPSVSARTLGSGRVAVRASWNGATEISRWQVLAGADPAALTPVASAPTSGFETALSVSTPQPLVAVRALDASGRDLGTSLAVRA